MKVKLLLLFCIVLIFSACKPQKGQPTKSDSTSNPSTDIKTVLRMIDSAGSGYAYIYDDQTIQAELDHFKQLIDKLDDRELISLLQIHLDRTQTISEYFMKLPVSYMLLASSRITTYAKPPNPCPGSGSICLYRAESLSFFAYSPQDSLIVIVDEQTIEADTVVYDEQTKIKTIKLKQKIEGNNIQLQKLDENRNVVGIYTEMNQ